MIKKSTAKDFAFFPSLSVDSYLGALSTNSEIDEETICFVADTGAIYTHSHQFGNKNTGSKTYTAGDYIDITSSNIINLDYDSLKNKLTEDGAFNTNSGGGGSTTGKTYSSGDNYINVNNSTNKISLNTSTLENKLTDDGFKRGNISLGDLSNVEFIGTVQSGQVLKYIDGKWKNGVDSTGSGNNEQQDTVVVATYPYFKNIKIGEPVGAIPTSTNLNGWSQENINPEDDEDTWVVWITYRDNVFVTTSNPINITNGTGDNGADTNNIQWAYKLSDHIYNTSELQTIASNLAQSSDNPPLDWTDNPTGIDPQNRYEYETYRINNNGTWESWQSPRIRSAWGERGIDGDGVQYIYYASASTIAPIGDANPSTWVIPEANLTNRTDEYIKDGSGWMDNPIALQNLNQGYTEWVSQRKWNGENGRWEAYSQPALWAYYSKDGVADGYTYHLINEIMVVGTGEDNSLDNEYTNATGVDVFHNGTSITSYTLAVGRPSRTDGKKISQDSTVLFEVTEDNEISVTLQNIPEFAGASIVCPVTIQIANNGPALHTILTVVGIRNGADGEGAIDLKVSADAIRVNHDNTVKVPSVLNIGMTSGSTPYGVTQLPEGFEIYYTIDDSSVETQLTTDSFQIPVNASSKIVFYLKYNGDVIDQKDIPFIYDGAPAIAPSIYSIQYIDGQLYEEENDVYQYELYFKVYKDGQEVVTNGIDQTISVSIFGVDRSIEYEGYGDDEAFHASASTSDFQSESAVIYVKTLAGTILESLVIPIVKNGKDGISPDPVQGLQGTVIRFTNIIGSDWESTYGNTYFYDGNIVDNGIKYLDIVYCDGEYYTPKSGLTSYSGHDLGYPSYGTNSNWKYFNMMGNAAFETLIANNSYIKNLTSTQIVITKDNGDVVAGMANGTYLTANNNDHNITESNGVRIWAGPMATAGNVASAPFTVDEDGHIKATSGDFYNCNISNCVIDDSCTIQGVPIGKAIVVSASETDSLNNIYLDDTLPSNSVINIIVLFAYVAHPIKVYSTLQTRAYYDGSWTYMNDSSQQGYRSRTDIQKPGLFNFVKKDNVWYVMLTYAN